MSPATAELCSAVFKLRVVEGGRVDADLVLTLRTPEGVEHWSFDFSYQDLRIRPGSVESPRQQFDHFMRSLFEDHMYDLAQSGLKPDRPYEGLAIRLEIPDVLLQHAPVAPQARVATTPTEP